MGISPPIQAANIGMADSLILMVLALVVFGPRRLPQIGRQIGKLMFEFRKASNDFKFQMEEELRNSEEADRRKREEAERQKTLAETQTAVSEAKSAAEEARTAAAEAQSAIKEAQLATWAAESAYSPEQTYSPEFQPEPEPAPAEAGLRVRPPSIGAQVAAERPGRSVGNESAQETNSESAEISSPESAAETSQKIDPASREHPATESTTHHG